MSFSDFIGLKGAQKVRAVLDSVAWDARNGDEKANSYDWTNLGLWVPEHRWHGNNPETCTNVWKDMVLVAHEVLEERV